MSKIMHNDIEYAGTNFDIEDPKFDLSKYQVAGSVDKELYDAIVALGWENDVLEN